MKTFTPPLRTFALAAGAFFLMAADGPCTIDINVDDDDDEEECQDLGDICPNLSCENGNVLDDDGCPICECNTEGCDPNQQAIPECAFPVFDEASCSWRCDGGGGECFSDFDCGPGFFCALSDNCGRPEDPNGGAVCANIGFCVEIATECFSDADCGPGFRCELATSGGGAEDPAPPPPDQERPEDPIPPPPGGQCVLIEQGCFSDADCAEGFVCEFVDAAGALVAIQGICVEKSEPVECRSDDECAAGERCIEACLPDPNCPACDVCFFANICQPATTPCSSDLDCRADEVCSLDGNGAARPCFDADGDGQCDDGVCIPAIVDLTCSSDVDCQDGEFCNLSQGCVCDASCEIDPTTGDCLPCDCAEPVGFCDIRTCISDTDCAPGLVCEIFGVTGCENVPCEELPNGTVECRPCDPIPLGACVEPTTSCITDADCRDDQICALADALPPVCDPASPDCANRIAPPAGVCVDRVIDPCANVRCEAGTQCVVDAAGNAQCLADQGLCTSDQDCADGLICNAADVCLSDPNCAQGEACPDVCFGNCIAP
jgi:Cys-rich repeat protein